MGNAGGWPWLAFLWLFQLFQEKRGCAARRDSRHIYFASPLPGPFADICTKSPAEVEKAQLPNPNRSLLPWCDPTPQLTVTYKGGLEYTWMPDCQVNIGPCNSRLMAESIRAHPTRNITSGRLILQRSWTPACWKLLPSLGLTWHTWRCRSFAQWRFCHSFVIFDQGRMDYRWKMISMMAHYIIVTFKHLWNKAGVPRYPPHKPSLIMGMFQLFVDNTQASKDQEFQGA